MQRLVLPCTVCGVPIEIPAKHAQAQKATHSRCQLLQDEIACYNVKHGRQGAPTTFPTMTKTELRQTIEAAATAMKAAQAAFAAMPVGSIDFDDDSDIIADIALFEYFQQHDAMETSLYGEIFDAVSAAPQVVEA